MKKIFKQFILFCMVFNLLACTDFEDVFGVRPGTASSAVLKIDGTYYIASEGDTLPSVGEKYGITAYQLAMANGLETDDVLVVGQKLLIPTVEDTKKAGKEKTKVASKKIKKPDDKKVPKEPKEKVVKNTETSEPIKLKEEPPKKEYIWPTEGIVTSQMGPRRGRAHDGIDISAPFGAPVVAIKNGTVIFTGRMNGYGNIVIEKHSGNIFSAYAHLSEIKVEKGKKVKQGELLGLIGRTGRASATHLHFEIRSKTQAEDPLKFLPKKDPRQIKNLDNGEE